MDHAEVGAELARIGAEEAEQDRALSLIREAIADGLLGDGSAGRWLTETGRLIVAVTEGPDEAANLLRRIAPAASFEVVQVEHSLRTLEALAEVVVQQADAIGAPLTAVGVHESANCVSVGLSDLAAPASVNLRRSFEGRPVEWQEDRFVAAS